MTTVTRNIKMKWRRVSDFIHRLVSVCCRFLLLFLSAPSFYLSIHLFLFFYFLPFLSHQICLIIWTLPYATPAMSDQRQSLAWMKWRDQLKISLAAITTQKSPIITFHLPWSWFHVLFLWLFSTLIRIGTKWDDDASRPSFSLVLRCRLRGMRLSARANADAAFVSDNKRRDLCAETHNTSANGIKTAMFLNATCKAIKTIKKFFLIEFRHLFYPTWSSYWNWRMGSYQSDISDWFFQLIWPFSPC